MYERCLTSFTVPGTRQRNRAKALRSYSRVRRINPQAFALRPRADNCESRVHNGVVSSGRATWNRTTVAYVIPTRSRVEVSLASIHRHTVSRDESDANAVVTAGWSFERFARQNVIVDFALLPRTREMPSTRTEMFVRIRSASVSAALTDGVRVGSRGSSARARAPAVKTALVTRVPGRALLPTIPLPCRHHPPIVM